MLPNVFDPMPLGVTQSIRLFTKRLEGWFQQALSGLPNSLIEPKLSALKVLCAALKRKTSLNHISQAARSVLSSPEQVNQMIEDWNQIDFESLRSQTKWIMKCKSGLIELIESGFLECLKQNVTLETWGAWIVAILQHYFTEELIHDNINNETDQRRKLESAPRNFFLTWSFYSSMIMRDLTLRSSPSFGKMPLTNNINFVLQDRFI